MSNSTIVGYLLLVGVLLVVIWFTWEILESLGNSLPNLIFFLAIEYNTLYEKLQKIWSPYTDPLYAPLIPVAQVLGRPLD